MLLLLCCVQTSYQNEYLWTIQKEFQLDHPLIITNRNIGNVEIMRQLSKASQFARFAIEADDISMKGVLNVIYFVNSNYNIINKIKTCVV